MASHKYYHGNAVPTVHVVAVKALEGFKVFV